jgi:hypothetical protein
MGSRWNDTGRGNRRTRRIPCPSVTPSTISPTWNALNANPGFHGESPATNCLHNGATQGGYAALCTVCLKTVFTKGMNKL